MREHPFESLKRKDTGKPFEKEVVENWYLARAYVLDLLKDVAIGPESGEHLEILIGGDSPLMLSVIRQLALSCHFGNFEEYSATGRLTAKNRTVITLVTDKSESEAWKVLSKEEYLCNFAPQNYPYLDIDVRIEQSAPEKDFSFVIKEEDVRKFEKGKDREEIYSIDTRLAVLANEVYSLGAVIDNLPYEDINSIPRYVQALDTFRYRVLESKGTITVSRINISNVNCTDCFRLRANGVKSYAQKKGMSIEKAWEECNPALALSEHARWTTEKLIMGFRPLSSSEWVQHGIHFGSERSAYIKQLKNNGSDPVHIDILSYRELRRIDPDGLKYDNFLMLAIPLILGNKF